MRRSTLTKRLALAAGIPAAAAAGVLLAATTSSASSHTTTPIHTVAAQTTRPAVVTHARRDAVELRHHHRHAEPGDARGRANEPGEDVRGHDGEAEQGDEHSGDD